MHTRSKRLVSLLSVAAAALVFAAACGSDGGTNNNNDQNLAGFAQCDAQPLVCNSGPTKPGGTIVWASDQDLATWNSNSADGGHFATAQMLTGVLPGAFYAAPDLVFKWNQDLLAEEPKVTNTNPQTVVYKIRPEAKWSDDTPISAEDFIYQFKTQNTRDCKCPAASTTGYDTMESVVGSDGGKTVTVTWQAGKVYPDYQSLFGGLYPAHIAKANGGTDTPEGLLKSWEYFGATQPTWSGGAYLVESYTKGQQLIEVPNPKWYGKVKPSLEKMIFKIITDQSSFIPAMQNNEIQGAYPLASQDMVAQAGQLPNVYSRVGHGLVWEHIDLNLTNKYLADKALRQAIFTAINVQGIIDRTVGQYDKSAKQVLNHNYLPGSPYYKDVVSGTGVGKGNIDGAKQVLTTAGYKDVGTALKTPAGEAIPNLRFRHTAGNANRAATGEIVQNQLKQLGINVVIETTDDLSGTLDEGDYDMIVFAWVGTPATLAGADQIWGMTSESNFGQWKNPEADALLKQAVQQLDQAKGAELLNQANELMAKDFYVIPLYQRPTFIMVSSQYANIRDNATSSGYAYNNNEWGLRATVQ